VWQESFSGRALAGAERRFRPAWRASLSGRVVAGTAAAARRLAAGSLFLSLDAGRSRPLQPGSSSLTARMLVWVYATAIHMVGESWPGRTARRCARGVDSSVVAGTGAWRVVGAAALGVGIGRVGRLAVDGPVAGPLSAGIVSALAVAAAGGLALVAIPGDRDWTLRFGAVAAAALSVGALVGASAGVTPSAAVVLALVCVAAVVLPYRAELLLFLLAAFPWVDFLARRSLGGLSGAWDEMFLLGSLACLTWVVLVVRRWDLRTVPLLLPLCVAVVAAAGSVMLRQVPQSVGVFALRVTFQPLLFYFLGFLLPRDRRIVRWAVAMFLAASLLLALHGLYQYGTGAPMPASWVDAHEQAIGTRAYSIIENPNGLGAFLLLGTLLAVGLALQQIGTRERLVLAAVAVVLAAGIAVTFSRGAWLGLAVGLVALTALSRWRLLVGLAVAGTAVLVASPGVFMERLAFAFSGAYLAKSASAGRLYIWGVAAHRIVENPWTGMGLGTFGGTSAFLFGYTASGLWIDSFYLQLAAEGGLVLLVAFLWLLVRVGKGLVVAFVDQADPHLRGVVAGVFGGFVAVAFANLTASVWETVAVGSGFWFLVGFASAPLHAGFRLPRAGRLAIEARDGRPVGEVPSAEFRPGGPTATAERTQ